LQKTAQQSQIQGSVSSKQASHPVIQQLLSKPQSTSNSNQQKLAMYQQGTTASTSGLKLHKGENFYYCFDNSFKKLIWVNLEK